jgi:homocysteine S-methyltransferase
MATYRGHLPQLEGSPVLTDGGLETDLIFNRGIELPLFAAADALRYAEGREALAAYYRRYLDIADEHDLGFVLESPTWRASADWGEQLGYAPGAMDDLNEQAIELLGRLRDERALVRHRVISGQIGPRGDGYDPGVQMTLDQAAGYHARQIAVLARTDADLVTAQTMNYVEEAAGVAVAAASHGMPCVISFTVETDGRLPTGHTLRDAVEAVDAVATPAYYMINCAHPTHFEEALEAGEAWTRRIGGMRGNASKMSHAELDEAEALDDGNPLEFAGDCHRIRGAHQHINVIGGCCGTDHRHVAAVAQRVSGPAFVA